MSDDDIRRHLSWAMLVFGSSGILLNLIVILRILRLGLKKVPCVKLYFLSFAVADFIFSFGIIGHWMLTRGYIKLATKQDKLIAINWWRSMQGLSFVSSILHVIVITVDRLIATKYPIKHRTGANQSNAVIAITIIWTSSCFVTSTQFWLPLAVIDWIVNIGILVGSSICVVTYINIVHILYKRRVALNKFSASSQVSTSSRSLNTTRMGVSITAAFIICNLPFCIASFVQGDNWNRVVSMVMYTSLSINCVIDPIVYNIMDFVHMKKMNKTHSNHNVELVRVQANKCAKKIFVITAPKSDAV